MPAARGTARPVPRGAGALLVGKSARPLLKIDVVQPETRRACPGRQSSTCQARCTTQMVLQRTAMPNGAKLIVYEMGKQQKLQQLQQLFATCNSRLACHAVPTGWACATAGARRHVEGEPVIRPCCLVLVLQLKHIPVLCTQEFPLVSGRIGARGGVEGDVTLRQGGVLVSATLQLGTRPFGAVLLAAAGAHTAPWGVCDVAQRHP